MIEMSTDDRAVFERLIKLAAAFIVYADREQGTFEVGHWQMKILTYNITLKNLRDGWRIVLEQYGSDSVMRIAKISNEDFLVETKPLLEYLVIEPGRRLNS